MTRILDPLSGEVVDVDPAAVPFVEELWARLGGSDATPAASADGGHKTAPPAASSPRRRPERLIVPWQPAELSRVRAALPGRYQLMTDLGASLGLRQGELFGFNLEDLDQRAYRVRVQVKRVDGVLCFAPPKHQRERSAPVPANLRQTVTAHIATYGTVRVMLPWDRPGGKPRTLTLLHAGTHGGPLDRSYVNRLWKTAVLSAGLAWIPQDTGMHMLRHVAASRWIGAGADLLMVRDLLGHADTATTERYLHRLKTHDQRTRRVVDKAQPKTTPRPATMPAGVVDFAAERIRRRTP